MPFPTTFELLAGTDNTAAVDVMVAALDIADESVQNLAVGAILKRHPTRAVIELVRRAQVLSKPARELIKKKSPVLAKGLRAALLSGDSALRASALQLVCDLEYFTELPTLTRLLEEKALCERDAVESTIYDLVDRLYKHLQFGKEKEESADFLRNAQRMRHQAVATLEASCERFEIHHSRQVIEGLLILGDAQSVPLKKLIQEASSVVREIVVDLLHSSRHPGVMTLVIDSLADNYPLPATISAFASRTDPEFIAHLLETWPRELTPFQQNNVKKLESVSWLNAEGIHLDLLPPALHCAAVAFLMTTGLTETQKMDVLEWMVKFGSAEGRLAATEVLKDLDDADVQYVVRDGLESQQPEVQAWATGQLRAWSIPNAIELLVERIDSPVPEVRQAARGELAGFDVRRLLEIFDQLDSRMQSVVGKLVQKIDPETVTKLKGEMLNAIHNKRIRAARAALAMNLHMEVADALLEMARDPDVMVRRMAGEVLGKVRSPAALDMLRQLTRDGSPRVRQAATSALGEDKTNRDPARSTICDDQMKQVASLEMLS
jgi:hypothetical protein